VQKKLQKNVKWTTVSVVPKINYLATPNIGVLPLTLGYVSCIVCWNRMTTNVVFCREGDDATSIPAECCAVPYTLNGGLYHNCTVNTAVNNDFGCYNNNAQWVTCLQPDGAFLGRVDLGAQWQIVTKLSRGRSICPSVSALDCPVHCGKRQIGFGCRLAS